MIITISAAIDSARLRVVPSVVAAEGSASVDLLPSSFVAGSPFANCVVDARVAAADLGNTIISAS